MARLQDETLAYTLLRLTLGMNIFGHGLIRIIGGVGVFVANYMPPFERTPLPAWFVQPFLYALPAIELLIGLFVMLGLFTRVALTAGALLITSLTFGMSMQSQFGVTGLHLSYAVVYFILIYLVKHNRLSVDAWMRGRATAA